VALAAVHLGTARYRAEVLKHCITGHHVTSMVVVQTMRSETYNVAEDMRNSNLKSFLEISL